MISAETPIVFDCAGDALVGVVHKPDTPGDTGVLVVVGGPQYRVGSHRQFLQLARALARAGFPVLRFDYRGMGDSEGEFRGFEAASQDIAAALDAFQEAVPGIRNIALWGLCDGASAILFYAGQDPRVSRVVLLNPWVRTEEGQARAMLRHYYVGQLMNRQFWGKLLSGEVPIGPALRDFAKTVLKRFNGARVAAGKDAGGAQAATAAGLPERMAIGLRRFQGPALLILSGKDLTAREFEDAAASSPLWSQLLGESRVTVERLPEADHTFSRSAWRGKVEQITCRWLEAAPTGIVERSGSETSSLAPS